MAGAEAEIEFLGDCAGGDSDDRDKIEEMAASDDSYFTPEEWKRYEPRMRRHARRIVKHHRAKIERLANALLERGTLQGQEIDRILDQHPKAPA
jgi:ATP-dependent Zn protease